MALLDDDLTGEAFITAKIRSAFGVIGFWLFVVGILVTITFTIGTLFSLYMVFDSATSTYFRMEQVGSTLVSTLLNMVGAYAGVLLIQGGGSMRKYLRAHDQADLETSFVKQKIFWTIFGVTTVLVSIGMLLVFVILMIEFLD